MTDAKNYMYKSWWKIASVVLLVYTFTAGLLLDVPRLAPLQETIRNLYFHVCMWFAMMILFTISVVNAIRYLRTFKQKYDIYARQYAMMGIYLGLLGYATGTIWASYTWADPNKPVMDSFSSIARDPKLIGAAIALLVYFAYLILRDSIQDMDKKARISSVYNIFAYVMLIVFLMVLPRVSDSLHPGNGGNPGFNKYDLDSNMRMVFYPAVIGWILLTVWILNLRVRLEKIKRKTLFNE